MVDDLPELSDKEKLECAFHISEDTDLVEPWNRKIATQLAKKQGITLTDERWEIVQYLRKLYEGTGELDSARDLSAVIDQRFKQQGGLKYAFTLFPKGPVSQGCEIAGIPVPKHSKNSSFGSVA